MFIQLKRGVFLVSRQNVLQSCRRVIFSSSRVTGCRLAKTMTKRLMLTDSFCLREDDLAYVNNSHSQLVDLQGKEHVAALCPSTWFLSCTHTAHVLPTQQRGSAHTPPEVRNRYSTPQLLRGFSVSVCVWEREEVKDGRPRSNIFTFRCTTHASNMWYEASTADICLNYGAFQMFKKHFCSN